MVLFDTYHCALVIRRRVFDWNAGSILVLDGLAHPHSSMP
jgi:hypothetical protein